MLCGQATVLLLAIGSIVLTVTRDGASRAVGMDDLRAFLNEPSATHSWFYLLAAVLGLYALNTLLATCRSVYRKWLRGLRAPSTYAPALIHVSFLVALLAHAVGGLAGSEGASLVIGPSWVELNAEREARLSDLDIERLPNGDIKQVWASVEVRGDDGTISSELVSYNGPLSSGLGSDLFLLARVTAIGIVKLSGLGQRCEAAVDEPCQLGPTQILPLYIHPATSANQPSMARVRLPARANAPAVDVWLTQGQPQRMADGQVISLDQIAPRPAILMRGRHTPGNPWALLSAVLLGLGLLMMWRRLIPRRGAQE